LICGAFSAVIHSTPSLDRISSRLAFVTIPRSETTTTVLSPKRAFSLSICERRVLSSWSSPEKTSTATGRPGLSQSSP